MQDSNRRDSGPAPVRQRVANPAPVAQTGWLNHAVSAWRLLSVCPQRDSNPRYHLERVATWAASRWGRPGREYPWPELPSVAARAVSSAGRAPALHAGGRRFESCTAHYGKAPVIGAFRFRADARFHGVVSDSEALVRIRPLPLVQAHPRPSSRCPAGHAPEELLELRATLLQEHVWLRREGLA